MPQTKAASLIKKEYLPFQVDLSRGDGRRTFAEDESGGAAPAADLRELRSPWDGEVIARLGWMSEVQALHNLDSLVRTHQSGQIPKTAERISILKRAAAKLLALQDEFADLIAWEGGKPLKDAKAEVSRAIDGLELAAEEAGRIHGEEIPMRRTAAASGRLAFTIPEPIGVVFAISAFNHPLNLIVHQVAPAIAVGCPVMVKPAAETPLSCLHLLELLYESGLAPAMCLPLITDNEIAEKIVRSERIAFLSFIGSAKVGWYLRSILAPGTRFSLEHGGSAPVLVDRSADLDLAIPILLKGGYYHAGQVCVSVQRVFVHEELASEFTEKFVAGVKALRTGDPRLASTDCGPIIRNRDLERIDTWVSEALRDGAVLACGGGRLGKTCYQPTVLKDVPAASHVMKDEIFGPVVCVNQFRDIEDAMTQAGAVPWSFQAAVFSRDLESSMQAARGLRASAVMINDATTFRVDWMPFRGDGPSGYGTGGISYAMSDLTKQKMIVLKSPAFNL